MWIDDRAGPGPDGWRATASVVAGVRTAFVTVDGNDAVFARKVILAALLIGPAVLVETMAAHVEAWAQAFQDARAGVTVNAHTTGAGL
jgi:hypothetical protein